MSRVLTYILGTLALYALLIALTTVFQFSTRFATVLRWLTFVTVLLLLVTGPLTLVKVGISADEVPSWTRAGGQLFNQVTLIYGLGVCATCVWQFWRLILSETLLHVRLRWIAITFAALMGCFYTIGRIAINLSLFGSEVNMHPMDGFIRQFLILAFMGLGAFFLLGPLFQLGTRVWMHFVALRQLRSLERLQSLLDIQPIIDDPAMLPNKWSWHNTDYYLCQSIIALLDAKHQVDVSGLSAEKRAIFSRLMQVDDNLTMPELIRSYSAIGTQVSDI